MNALADNNVDFQTGLSNIHSHVAAGVAAADNQDAIAFEVIYVLVLTGVDLSAGKFFRYCGDLGIPQMAISY